MKLRDARRRATGTVYVDQTCARCPTVFEVAKQNRDQQTLCKKCQAEMVRLRKAQYNLRLAASVARDYWVAAQMLKSGMIVAPAGMLLDAPGTTEVDN
jgi:uncharacterized paraquat-inducible protein A